VNRVIAHIRNKLIAGVFAAIPLVICVYVAIWVESHTKVLTEPLGFHFPGLGFIIVLVGVYLLGVAVTSYLGRFFLKLLDWVVGKVPGLKVVAKAWKDVLVVSPEKSGMYHQAVLVPVEGNNHQLGFTSGRELPGAAYGSGSITSRLVVSITESGTASRSPVSSIGLTTWTKVAANASALAGTSSW